MAHPADDLVSAMDLWKHGERYMAAAIIHRLHSYEALRVMLDFLRDYARTDGDFPAEYDALVIGLRMAALV